MGLLTVPSAVAIVGASRLEGGSYYGARLMANVLAARPTAVVYPINPRLAGEDIEGHRVYADLAELPAVPDMVVITTPVATIGPILRQAAAMGVRTSVIISAERGDEAARARFSDEVAAIARESGMRIIGPNSMGVMNAHAGLNCSFTSATHGIGLTPGPLAAITQSGAAIAYLLQVFRGTSLGYSWLISTGNETGTSFEQIFEEVLQDERTQVLLLFVEGLSDGLRFRRSALAARNAGKAVLMLNVGVSDAGRGAVQSHTGRIAGANEALAAVADEASIVRATTFQDLFDAAKALVEQAVSRRERPHSRRAVVLTTSGGAGTLTADLLSARGWTLPDLAPDIVAEIEVIGKQKGVGNPVDVTGAFADKTMLRRLITAVSHSENIDAIIVATGAGGTLAAGVAAEIVEGAKGLRQEVYVAWVGMTPQVAEVFDGTPVTAYPDPSRAVAAAEACALFRSGQAQRAAVGIDSALGAYRAQLQGGASPRLRAAAEVLDDVTAAGVRCAPYAVCPSLERDAVVAASSAIGYPVVLKLDAPAMSHKSDAGGVALDLRDAAAVESALARLRRVAEEQQLVAPRLLVQAMVRGVEVLVGIKRDHAFGPLLVVGLGGTTAELHADSAVSILLPATPERLDALVARHRTLPTLLAGYRGQPRCDEAGLRQAIERIALWATGKGEALDEADFNPVIVNAEGAFVADARAVY